MRLLLTVLVLCLVASTAAGAECLPGTRAGVINAETWQVADAPRGVTIEVDNRNHSGKTIRMVSGAVMFFDTLGGFVASIPMDRDVPRAKNEVTRESGVWSLDKRLLSLHRDDVAVVSCVIGVVYDDGTTERFE